MQCKTLTVIVCKCTLGGFMLVAGIMDDDFSWVMYFLTHSVGDLDLL